MNDRLKQVEPEKDISPICILYTSVGVAGVLLAYVMVTGGEEKPRSPSHATNNFSTSEHKTLYLPRTNSVLRMVVEGRHAHIVLNDFQHDLWKFNNSYSLFSVITEFEKEHGKIIFWKTEDKLPIKGNSTMVGLYIIFEPKEKEVK